MRADQLSITIKSLKLKQRHFSALIYDNNCYVISSPYLPTVPKLHAKDFVELYCKLIRNSKIRSIIEANFPRIPTKIHKYNADFIVRVAVIITILHSIELNSVFLGYIRFADQVH